MSKFQACERFYNLRDNKGTVITKRVYTPMFLEQFGIRQLSSEDYFCHFATGNCVNITNCLIQSTT